MPRRTFWKDFDDQKFLCSLNYGVLKLSPLLDESISLEVHFSNLRFP
jgi:hypothetical protein